jgi:cyclopropane fatty-acyl-phospholipid synthase-like methyltransferase
MKDLLRRISFILRYLGKPPWDTHISPPELLEFMTHHPPGKALDLGCGTGTNMLTLAQAGWEVCGIDYIWSAVLQARTRLKKVGIEAKVFCCDAVDIDFLEQKFDLILDIGCFHGLSINQKDKYLQNLNRLINSNGSFLIYAYLQNGSSNFGFNEIDFSEFCLQFHLNWRRDGIGRLKRPSAWMQFDKK